MATSSIKAPVSSASSESRLRRVRFRPRHGWRVGFLLVLVLMVPPWIRSWEQIDAWRLSFGPSGHLEFCNGGSSVGFIVSTLGIPAIDFHGPTGPLDEKHRFPYEVQWADGTPLGTALNSCLFPPHHSEVTDCQLDRIGSFGTSLNWPESAHLHLPYWLLALGILGIWLFYERRYFRRSALNSPSDPQKVSG